MSNLKVAAFNVLAAPWAKPSSYPVQAAPYLPREYRRGKNLEVILSLAPTTDVFCLQETTVPEFEFYRDHLPGFTGFQNNHDPSYWSKYVTETIPWELNGTAIFIKNSKFSDIEFEDLINSNTGNHAAFVKATHLESGKRVGVVSIHLDSDTGGNRNKEMNAIIAHLASKSVDVRFIAGDFNFATGNGNFEKDIRTAGYIDVLAAVGNNDRTHPDDKGYANSRSFQIIDHVLVQNGVPLDGDVIDNNLFVLYPENSNTNNDLRVTENIRLIGSDHFAVWGLARI